MPKGFNGYNKQTVLEIQVAKVMMGMFLTLEVVSVTCHFCVTCMSFLNFVTYNRTVWLYTIAMHRFYFGLPQIKVVFSKYQVATMSASEKKVVI